MGRKQKKHHYIYKTTCSVTNRYYIGMHSTNNLEDGYLGSGKRLWFSINYHGKDKHTKEILEFCENRKQLKKREEQIVNEQLLKEDLCMNLKTGGTGGFVDDKHRLKFINSNGPKNFAKKVKEDKEFGDKIRLTLLKNVKKAHANGNIKYNTFTDRKHTEETKRKMSKAKKGKYIGKQNSQYGTCWITRDGQNKKIKKEELSEYKSKGWLKGRK